MEKLRAEIGVSFREIEQNLWNHLRDQYCRVLRESLEFLDDQIFKKRDKQRYRVRERVTREVETLVGPVSFKRRAYIDTETGQTVYLLDEVLDLAARRRVAPGLAAVLAELAVLSPSYREARNATAELFGERLVSHETIRQILRSAGKQLQAQQKTRQHNPAGKRKVKVLFLEVDGFWVSLQREKKRRLEVRVLVAHEGWRSRHPRSREFELINPLHFTWVGDPGEFWEPSAFLEAHYDLEHTVIVINGDRAFWIRQGVEWFPQALYQVDRFHLIRDLKQLLRNQPEQLKAAREAVRKSEATTLLAVLATAAQGEKDRKLRDGLKALLADLAEIPESTRDYRVRLKEMGLDTNGYRGLGAGESQIDRYSNRVKKRGQSWSLEGLSCMLSSLNARFAGYLKEAAQAIESRLDLLSDIRFKTSAAQVLKTLSAKTEPAFQVHLPILDHGRTTSRGCSIMLRKLSHPRPALT